MASAHSQVNDMAVKNPIKGEEGFGK